MRLKKSLSFAFDALIFFWAASGVALAFGFGALLSMARSGILKKSPLPRAAFFARKARSLIGFIYASIFKKPG